MTVYINTLGVKGYINLAGTEAVVRCRRLTCWCR